MNYEPNQNPNCTQPKTIVMPDGSRLTMMTMKDTCDDVYCCYCHGCEYNDQDIEGTPVCEICGEYEEYE